VNKIPGILMVTWNRREYFERTIRNLLSDPSDFRLYFWDNGSTDGVRELIDGLTDHRIAAKHLNEKNVGQFEPWHWFLANCREQIAGKLDDDILGETGWMTRFSEMICRYPQIGNLGAWVYQKDEWDPTIAAHKIVDVGDQKIFRNGWVAGCIFVGRTTYLKKYSSTDPTNLGTPIDHLAMTKAGLINGYPLPISFAENMDDPRSSYCRMNRPGGWDQFAAYTARMRNFSGPEEYGRWIAADARMVLETPIREQIRMSSPSLIDRLKAKIARRTGAALSRLGAAKTKS